MFTGIVEELGRLVSSTPRGEGSATAGARLRIAAHLVLEDVELGASIAVEGVCLTVVGFGDGWWDADAVSETLDRSTLGSLPVGTPLNLERPVRLADRLGGHLVQGHVDGVGTLSGRTPNADGSTRVDVAAPPGVLRYVVEKGSITVDGISLTVAGVERERFSAAVIPHTSAVTSLGTKPVGAAVNLEVDILAKYVERLLPGTDGTGR